MLRYKIVNAHKNRKKNCKLLLGKSVYCAAFGIKPLWRLSLLRCNCWPAMSWLLSLIAWSLLCLVQHFSDCDFATAKKRVYKSDLPSCCAFPRLTFNHISSIQNVLVFFLFIYHIYCNQDVVLGRSAKLLLTLLVFPHSHFLVLLSCFKLW